MKNFEALTQQMQRKVPNAQLRIQALPQVPRIRLALIEDTYPQEQLTSEQVEYLMDNPPYWAFCWASGQVLSRYLLDHPSLVRNKTVIDFGCGSGVVAIAAKLAGASSCVALDIDQTALAAAETNAALNGVELILAASLDDLNLVKAECVMLIADVFYDASNIPMLNGFLQQYGSVIVADSRVKPSALTGVVEVSRFASATVPDLGENTAFNSVGIYLPA